MGGDRFAHRGAVAVDQIEDARPAGRRRATISANNIALSGAISLGFSTTVQPVASAGATLEATWFSGQFHGVISPQTPIGSRRTIPLPMRSSNL